MSTSAPSACRALSSSGNRRDDSSSEGLGGIGPEAMICSRRTPGTSCRATDSGASPMIHDVNPTSFDTPKKVWIRGRRRSQSRRTTRRPALATTTARLARAVVLPSPALGLEMASTFAGRSSPANCTQVRRARKASAAGDRGAVRVTTSLFVLSRQSDTVGMIATTGTFSPMARWMSSRVLIESSRYSTRRARMMPRMRPAPAAVIPSDTGVGRIGLVGIAARWTMSAAGVSRPLWEFRSRSLLSSSSWSRRRLSRWALTPTSSSRRSRSASALVDGRASISADFSSTSVVSVATSAFSSSTFLRVCSVDRRSCSVSCSRR